MHNYPCYVNYVLNRITVKDFDSNEIDTFCQQAFADVELDGVNNGIKTAADRKTRNAAKRKMPSV